MADDKKTKMAAEAETEHQAARQSYVGDSSLWDKSREPEYGGQSEILELGVGEVSRELVYVSHQPMKTALGDTTVHTATTPDGSSVRLPISAAFLRALDQSGIKRGDTFLVKRFEDVKKQAGKGAGQNMQIYAVKVLNRAGLVGGQA